MAESFREVDKALEDDRQPALAHDKTLVVASTKIPCYRRGCGARGTRGGCGAWLAISAPTWARESAVAGSARRARRDFSKPTAGCAEFCASARKITQWRSKNLCGPDCSFGDVRSRSHRHRALPPQNRSVPGSIGVQTRRPGAARQARSGSRSGTGPLCHFAAEWLR